jgi:phage baseplate assembly protein W
MENDPPHDMDIDEDIQGLMELEGRIRRAVSASASGAAQATPAEGEAVRIGAELGAGDLDDRVAALEWRVLEAVDREEAARAQSEDLKSRLPRLEKDLEASLARERESRTRCERLKALNQELTAKIEESRRQLNSQASEVSELEAVGAMLEFQLNEFRRQCEAETARAHTLKQRISELEGQLDAARQKVSEGKSQSRELVDKEISLKDELRYAQSKDVQGESKSDFGSALAEQIADFEARLKLKAEKPPPVPEAVPPAPAASPESAAPAAEEPLPSAGGEPYPMPVFEPVLEAGWTKVVGFLRQTLASAYAQLRKISATPLADEQRTRLKQAAGSVAQSSDCLATLAEFLDEAGPPAGPNRLDTAVAAALLVWEPAFRARSIKVTRRMETQMLQAQCHADGLRQALYQVLRNVYECMPRGGSLTVRFFQEAASGLVCVSFTDTGRGFTREALLRTSVPFSTTKPGHLGLGLPLARRILGRWGGSVDVANNTGCGATVTLRLTAAKDAPPSLDPAPGASGL